MDLTEQTIHSEVVFTGNLLTVQKRTVILPDGRRSGREVVLHPGAAAVVAVDADGYFILVRQYRTPVGAELWEIPAGKLDPGEDPLACAKRELREETGYHGGNWVKLTAIWTTPGFTNEIIHLYAATGLTRDDAAAGGDPEEFVTVERFSPEQVKQMIRSGEINDAKSLAGFLTYWLGAER